MHIFCFYYYIEVNVCLVSESSRGVKSGEEERCGSEVSHKPEIVEFPYPFHAEYFQITINTIKCLAGHLLFQWLHRVMS